MRIAKGSITDSETNQTIRSASFQGPSGLIDQALVEIINAHFNADLSAIEVSEWLPFLLGKLALLGSRANNGERVGVMASHGTVRIYLPNFWLEEMNLMKGIEAGDRAFVWWSNGSLNPEAFWKYFAPATKVDGLQFKIEGEPVQLVHADKPFFCELNPAQEQTAHQLPLVE